MHQCDRYGGGHVGPQPARHHSERLAAVWNGRRGPRGGGRRCSSLRGRRASANGWDSIAATGSQQQGQEWQEQQEQELSYRVHVGTIV